MFYLGLFIYSRKTLIIIPSCFNTVSFISFGGGKKVYDVFRRILVVAAAVFVMAFVNESEVETAVVNFTGEQLLGTRPSFIFTSRDR